MFLFIKTNINFEPHWRPIATFRVVSTSWPPHTLLIPQNDLHRCPPLIPSCLPFETAWLGQTRRRHYSELIAHVYSYGTALDGGLQQDRLCPHSPTKMPGYYLLQP